VSDLEKRVADHPSKKEDRWGSGRELFAGMRRLVGPAEEGASSLDLEET